MDEDERDKLKVLIADLLARVIALEERVATISKEFKGLSRSYQYMYEQMRRKERIS